MDAKHLLFFIFAAVAVGCSPNSGPSDATESSSSQNRAPSTPGESVMYKLPGDTDLEVLQEGKINEKNDSYILVIGNPENSERLAITVLPAVDTSLTWPEQAQEWEAGFLKNMSRKLLSEPADFHGREAHHIVAEAGAGDDSVKIDAYFFSAGPWNYTIAVTGPSSIKQANEELVSVRDSIQVRSE